MKRYPVYRDSGLAFVEKIPQHWEAKRAKYCFYEVDERSETGDEELLSVSHITGVTPRSEKNITMFMAESYEGYKTCIPNDLVINIMWAWMGALGISKYQGIISSAYGVYRQKDTNKFYSDYLEYLVRIPEYIAEYTRTSKGIRSSRLRMYSDDFFQIPIICPLLEEQKTIAHFLDRKLEQISHFISNKQRLIELLKEQKTAIVNRAVTKGLNPHTPMKNSGIKWLGEIPKHWKLKKLKWFAKTESGSTPDSGKQKEYYKDGNINWVRTLDLNNNEICDTEIKITEKAIIDTSCKIMPPGTVLIAMYGGEGTIGKNGILRIFAATNQAVCCILPNNNFVPEFLHRYVQFYRPHWMFDATGARKDPNISQEIIRELIVVFPPMEEQKKIVVFIKNESATIDQAISKRHLRKLSKLCCG